MPSLSANFALTADGRISTRSRTPANFGSPADQRRLLEIRAKCDAVLVGARTVAADCMTIGLPAEDLRKARIKRGWPPFPLRVIVSNSGRIDPKLGLFTKEAGPIVIFSTTRMPMKIQAALAQKAELFLHESSTVNLAAALATLREDFRVKRVVCEGGGALFHSLLAANLVDELHLTLCPRIFGGAKAPTLTGLADRFLPKSTHLRLVEMLPTGAECFTRWRVVARK